MMTVKRRKWRKIFNKWKIKIITLKTIKLNKMKDLNIRPKLERKWKKT